MLVAFWIHLCQRLLFVSDGATGAQACDTPHVMILSDTAKYYQYQDYLESFFGAHYTGFVLLSDKKDKQYNRQ